ncbi:hypothetical protein ACFWIY_11970 [Streptomyces sioyaensis]|uniref:hypothetical protein n=1 Tax=Streptomyces sioyaensis TaxID=67364 RepID=UPI00365E7643
MTTGAPAAAGPDDEGRDPEPCQLNDAEGDAGALRSAAAASPSAARENEEPSPDPDGAFGASGTAGAATNTTTEPGNDEESSSPPTMGRRFRRWLGTVPGLAASTVVTTACAAATTAAFTGGVQLWSEPASVSTTVETDPLRIDAEKTLVQLIPADRFDRTRPDKGCAGFWDWARKRGAVDDGSTMLQLTVTNSGSNAALITGMRAEVLSRTPVSHMVEATCPTQGEAQVYAVNMNLDEPQPVGVYQKEGKHHPLDFTVAAGELETFLVTADITHGASKWKLAVDVVEDGQKRTLMVDNDGKPFATAARPKGIESWTLDPHANGDWHAAGHVEGASGRPQGRTS